MKKDKVSITFVVSKEMRERIEKIAVREERTMSWIIRKAVEEYLEREEKEN